MELPVGPSPLHHMHVPLGHFCGVTVCVYTARDWIGELFPRRVFAPRFSAGKSQPLHSITLHSSIHAVTVTSCDLSRRPGLDLETRCGVSATFPACISRTQRRSSSTARRRADEKASQRQSRQESMMGVQRKDTGAIRWLVVWIPHRTQVRRTALQDSAGPVSQIDMFVLDTVLHHLASKTADPASASNSWRLG